MMEHTNKQDFKYYTLTVQQTTILASKILTIA